MKRWIVIALLLLAGCGHSTVSQTHFTPECVSGTQSKPGLAFCHAGICCSAQAALPR